jgi:hypothetical protein
MNSERPHEETVNPAHCSSVDPAVPGDGSPQLSAFDILAIALLAAGCLSGLGLQIRREWLQPAPAATPSPQALQARIRELENRLLEQVSRSIEAKYGDL